MSATKHLISLGRRFERKLQKKAQQNQQVVQDISQRQEQKKRQKYNLISDIRDTIDQCVDIIHNSTDKTFIGTDAIRTNIINRLKYIADEMLLVLRDGGITIQDFAKASNKIESLLKDLEWVLSEDQDTSPKDKSFCTSLIQRVRDSYMKELQGLAYN